MKRKLIDKTGIISAEEPPKVESHWSRLRRLKRLITKRFARKKVKGMGRLTGANGWTEEEIQEVIHEIGKRCPGVTNINVSKNEISFHFECSPDEFLRKRKRELPNPSKRKQEEELK